MWYAFYLATNVIQGRPGLYDACDIDDLGHVTLVTEDFMILLP